jgi:hypothetical protein
MNVRKTKTGSLIIKGKAVETDTMFNVTREQVCIRMWGTQSCHCCHIGIEDIDLYISELQELKNIFKDYYKQ